MDFGITETIILTLLLLLVAWLVYRDQNQDKVLKMLAAKHDDITYHPKWSVEDVKDLISNLTDLLKLVPQISSKTSDDN